MTNQCAYCNHQLNPSDKFCSACGNPIKSGAIAATRRGNSPEYQQLGTPIPELRNPQGLLRSGDLTLRIEGEVVPVVDVQLGQQQSIYFEHHILLWKHPNVRLGVKGLKGAVQRYFAGLQIFISEAHGPGNIAFSRDAPGQIVALPLERGQTVDVREHQFLLATSNVEYSFFFQRGLVNLFFSRSGGLFIDRFQGKRDGGLLLIHGYGNVFEKYLAPGEMLDVEPGAWLWKDSSVRMETVTGYTINGVKLGQTALIAYGSLPD